MGQIKYILFSSKQLEFRRNAEKKLGRGFKPGEVLVNGSRYSFTEISSNGSEKSRYSDTKMIYHGDLDKVKIYSMPGIE